MLHLLVTCDSRKSPYSFHAKFSEILRERGSGKLIFLKKIACTKLNWNLRKGREGAQTKNLSWEGYRHFVEQYSYANTDRAICIKII